MSRLAWSQLRYRAARSVALLLGVLVAVTAFCVLTASARTSQLRTAGTVSAHFRAAYDILVRPKGSRTRLESSTGTVQPNFLSGIYGGISLRQYHDIAQLPGVSVAAPIAMVGYSLPIVPAASSKFRSISVFARNVSAARVGVSLRGRHDVKSPRAVATKPRQTSDSRAAVAPPTSETIDAVLRMNGATSEPSGLAAETRVAVTASMGPIRRTIALRGRCRTICSNCASKLSV